MSLTAKQEAFISEYLVDLNATQAAIRAGYSEKTAYSIGHENLSKPEIADSIADARKEAAKRNETNVDMIDKMHKQAFSVANNGKQASAMTTAANNLAKLHGLIIDKAENTHKGSVNVAVNVIPKSATD